MAKKKVDDLDALLAKLEKQRDPAYDELADEIDAAQNLDVENISAETVQKVVSNQAIKVKTEVDEEIDELDLSGVSAEEAVEHELTSVPASQIVHQLKETQVVTRANIQTNADAHAAVNDMLQQVKREFDNVGKKILDNYEADRDQQEGVIQTLLGMMGSGDNPPRVVVEGLVQLLGTKASTSMTAVKLLEVKTKLLAALKGGLTINNTNVATAIGTDAELTEFLSSTPESNDFDDV